MISGTIIFSIHQPRYSIFKLFDTITLLCQGKIYYHGQSDDMLDYFAQQGHSCESHDNPADFVIDLLIDSSRKTDKLEELKLAYEKSSMHNDIKDVTQTKAMVPHLEHQLSQGADPSAQSRWKEIYYVTQRTLKNSLRNPAIFLSQIAVALIIGLLIGLVYYNLEKTIDPGVQNRLGAVFMMAVSQIFSTLTALEPIIKERALFVHVSFFSSINNSRQELFC